jgi:hypothetical protein
MNPRVQPKRPRSSAPPRVRHEPATIDEAVHAALGLTSDIDQQVEIAAGLIGMAHHEVREHVLRLQQSIVAKASNDRPARLVVVERRSTPRLIRRS